MPSISDTHPMPHSFRRAALFGLLAFGLITLLGFLTSGQNLENLALDLGYQLRPVEPPPPGLLIVGIDEASFQELRRPWPWPRRFHAELINRLAKAGARLIIFDVLFADPTDSEDDEIFAQAMRRAGNVILARTIETSEEPRFSRQMVVDPLKRFGQSAAGVALLMVTPDADGVVRRFRLHLGGLETLAALVIRRLRPQSALPDDFSGLIHYLGPPGSIETVSYYQLLDSDQPLPAAKIHDRIVLVGRLLETSFEPLAKIDAFYTPFFAGSRLHMSGVEIQGHIINTLLQGNWGRELSWPLRLVLYFFVLLPFSLLVTRLSPLSGSVALGGSVLLLGGTSFLLFRTQNLWVPPTLLSLGLLTIYVGSMVDYFFREVREKRWLRQAFSRYVSPSLVENIVSHPERLELGGEEVEVTVLFADIENFTAISEDMTPRELILILDEYFDTLTQIILDQQGTVDKYIGDALMCFWGAPLPMPDHAVRACRASLEIKVAIQDLQQSFRERGLPQLSVRLGINSGLVVAGNIGSRERFNYTVMGDTVNLAARLEKANKYYGSKILLSEATHNLVGNTFMARELDHILVKGRVRSVDVYELLDYLPAAGLPVWLQQFADGLAAYRRREWAQALDRFKEVLKLRPDDIPAKLYHGRCFHYLKHPPPPDWQGIHSLGVK